MPTSRATDHRILSGTHPTSDFSGTTGAVKSRTKASDQPTDPNFWIIDTLQSTAPRAARTTTMLDLSADDDGYYSWQWVMSVMTSGMLTLWYADFLPSGAASGLVTVRTYTDADVSVYLTATIYRPVFPQDGQRILGAYANVIWRFDGGTVIT